MEHKGLLFIPDISGFTRFINAIEIDHSRMIIQELLEVLMNANEIGLEVSEIEGDAILFYKFGDPPELEILYKQVEKMFCEFHKNLLAYEHRRYCQCKACLAVSDLTLKVITHYGEFAGYNVKQFNKLIGKDIIVAHQLLKNDIDAHEYWLITPALTGLHNPPAGFTPWMKWDSSIKQTESGNISFLYTKLSELKKEIPNELMAMPDLSNKIKSISVSEEYETDIISLFHAAGDFNNRSRWYEGIKRVEEIGHHLPRTGMRCLCIMQDGTKTIFSSSYAYQPDNIQFSETEENNDTITWFLLETTGINKTKLTLDIYTGKGIISRLFFNFFKKKKQETILKKSLANLHAVIKEIRL